MGTLTETKLAKDKSFSYNAPEGFDVFLRNNIHLFPLQQTRIDEFYSLYRHARHEPKVCYHAHYWLRNNNITFVCFTFTVKAHRLWRY